jgi:hypothetical protein
LSRIQICHFLTFFFCAFLFPSWLNYYVYYVLCYFSLFEVTFIGFFEIV